MIEAPRPSRFVVFFAALFFLFAPAASAATKRVVLLPIALNADPSKAYLQKGLKSMFMSRLAGEDLDVVGEEALAPLLNDKDKQGVTSEKRAEELARQVKADYAIFGSVTALGAGFSLDFAILDLTKEKPEITTVSESGGEDLLIPKVADIVYDFRAVVAGVDTRAQRAGGGEPGSPRDSSSLGLFFRASPGGDGGRFSPAGRIRVRPAPVSMDAGDLDGDGEAELVVLSSHKVFLYTRKGDTYDQRVVHESSAGENFLKVSVGDVDGNGRAEIYLVSLTERRAVTTVWEWSGKLTQLAEQAGHLRALRDPAGKGSLLLYQDSRPGVFFNGGIYFMRYEGKGKLVRKDPLPDLKEPQFYTLSMLDLSGIPVFVGLGEYGQLHLWSREGGVLWHDEEKIEGTNNAVRSGTLSTDSAAPMLFLDSRIVALDIDKDGSKEIIAVQNTASLNFLENQRLFEKASLLAYRAAGSSLSSVWKTPTIGYCVMDIQAVNNSLFVLGQKGSRSMIDEGSGLIMWFE